MASLEGLKRRLNEYRPHVESAFIVYVTPRPSPVDDVDDSFDMVEISTGDDPLLPRICNTKRQLAIAATALDEGKWNIIVALKDGDPVGRIWECLATEKRYFAGVPRFRLAEDEFVMFDLFVEREYRRSGIAFTMADYFFKKYSPDGDNPPAYGYGFISYDNVPSILWHHSVGFQIAQTVNYLAIGPYIKWKMPFSDMPRFGPLSRKGRHTDPDREMFGPPLMP